ncbi:MAG: hypothetical protein JWL77_4272 [Chthonomonadaceae bacterium]|nr:hypothetical protein [Chthonomonadaceae bacterium]
MWSDWLTDISISLDPQFPEVPDGDREPGEHRGRPLVAGHRDFVARVLVEALLQVLADAQDAIMLTCQSGVERVGRVVTGTFMLYQPGYRFVCGVQVQLGSRLGSTPVGYAWIMVGGVGAAGSDALWTIARPTCTLARASQRCRFSRPGNEGQLTFYA